MEYCSPLNRIKENWQSDRLMYQICESMDTGKFSGNLVSNSKAFVQLQDRYTWIIT